MNTLIIGGSNSRKKLGYTKSLSESLLFHTKSTGKFTNIALGANTCLLGLISLTELKEETIYDVVVIEYSVNDYAMTVKGDVDIWRAAFEGLIRQVCRRWPGAVICNVLLGRTNVEKSLWDNQLIATRKIAEHYPQVIVADVQDYLPKVLEAERLYADPMHYSQEAQELAGRFIANKIISRATFQYGTLPSPLTDNNFDQVGVVDFADINVARCKEFSNSAVVSVRPNPHC